MCDWARPHLILTKLMLISQEGPNWWIDWSINGNTKSVQGPQT